MEFRSKGGGMHVLTLLAPYVVSPHKYSVREARAQSLLRDAPKLPRPGLRYCLHAYVCMYVCMYACMYVCIYTYMYACIDYMLRV